jgi:hypothetical protein
MPDGSDPPADYRERFEAITGQSLRACPHRHTGIMVVIDCATRGLPAGSRDIMIPDPHSCRVKPTHPRDRGRNACPKAATDMPEQAPIGQVQAAIVTRSSDWRGEQLATAARNGPITQRQRTCGQ